MTSREIGNLKSLIDRIIIEEDEDAAPNFECLSNELQEDIRKVIPYSVIDKGLEEIKRFIRDGTTLKNR